MCRFICRFFTKKWQFSQCVDFQQVDFSSAPNNPARRRKITRKNPPPPCTPQAFRVQKDMGNLPTHPVQGEAGIYSQFNLAILRLTSEPSHIKRKNQHHPKTP